MNSHDPALSESELYACIVSRSRWHAWLYRWCRRLALAAFTLSLVALLASPAQPIADLWHQRWAGFPCYATQSVLLVVPILGLAWIAAIIRHHIVVRYQPPPNHSLQRTQAGGGVDSEFEP